ncbi:MAG: GspH/FimT family pseudopilin [Desulfobacterales bacterium]|nr:GspH/FimT family pseudopilin [Desulfobacterales bacterium]
MMDKSLGFTVVELLVVIAMIALVTAIAVPNFIGLLPDYRLRSATRDLFSNFQKAKLTAIKRNVNTAVCFHESGYVMFVDADIDFEKDSAEEAVTQVDWENYKSISVNTAAITFDSSSGQPCIAFRPTGIPADNGGGFASGTTPISNTNDRTTRVIISQAGNIRID